MKFPYKKLAKNVCRPIIPISVSYKGGTPIKYFALIDSGADRCYFASEIAAVIGISDFKTGREEPVQGVSGMDTAYFHILKVEIGGWPHDMEIGFIDGSNMSKLGYGILGHHPFFEQYVVKFDFLKEDIELKDAKK